jgi:Uma2 family endonuclease
MDVEDYLILDNTSKTAKYEYLDGELHMLAGGSPNHSIIANNIGTILNNALSKKSCIVYNSDVRFRLSESRYVHPDVTVSCDARDRYQEYDIQYPRLIVEVLSPSTQEMDKGEKLDLYLEYPTVEEYILVDSQKKSVQIYHRKNDSWTRRVYRLGSIIHLQSIDVEIAFDDIYKKTSLDLEQL